MRFNHALDHDLAKSLLLLITDSSSEHRNKGDS